MVLTQGKHFLVWCPLVVSQVSIQIGMFLCRFFVFVFLNKFRKVNKRVPLLSGKIIRTTSAGHLTCYIFLQELQWSPSHMWIAEAHMVPDQTADTVQWGFQTYLHGEVMGAFSLPHCLNGETSPKKWLSCSMAASQPKLTDQALLATELCQCAGDIGFELLADHKWSFSTKLIKSWLQF